MTHQEKELLEHLLLEVQKTQEQCQKISEQTELHYKKLLRKHNKFQRLYVNSLWLNKLLKHFKPKLGKLFQYPPRAIEIPSHYNQPITLLQYPKISIVTPAFNHGHFIEKTIKSVLDQHYPNLEYIIQDGGSTDNTAQILKQYESQLTRWESVKDKGQSNAINLGFSHTHGEIMAYLNSDDLLLPGTLHYVADYFQKHPEVDVVYGHRVLINKEDDEVGRWVLPPHQNKVLKWADYIPQETLFWRRSLWNKVNKRIDESFQFAMDWDLILRFIDVGACFERLPRFLGAFRVHPHQKSSAQISKTGKNEMQILRERSHGRPIKNHEIKKHLRFYLWHHWLLHKLYRLGWIQY